jgi:GT2 family glycosyltransferase
VVSPVTPRASIVVVHHRGLERLRRTLDQTTPQAAAERCEIIVVDNGSAEGVGDALRRGFPGVTCIRREENQGFAGGCQDGAEASEAELLVFLNDDAVPEAGWLSHLLSAAGRRPGDVAAIAGRLTDATGERNDFSNGFLTVDGHAFAADVGAPLAGFHAGEPGEERLFACGGNMIVARAAFLESGGFDRDFFAYLEDVDFGWRQWILGKRILFEPRAAARHEGGATGQALGIYRRGYLIEKNAFATAYKNLDEDRLRDFLPSVFAALLWRAAAMIDRRNPGASILGTNPYEALSRSGRKISRLLARLFGVADIDAARLDDPLTIAELQAIIATFRSPDALAARRAEVQRRRVRPDREIFERFPIAVVPTYPGDELFASRFFDSLRPQSASLTNRSLEEIFPVSS